MKKQFSQKLRAISLQSVIDVATELAKSGEITTLEVKNELRSRGYFVSQSEVSTLMNEMYEDPNQNGWSFTANGNHRVYSHNPAFNASATITISNPSTIKQFKASVLNVSYKGRRRPALIPLSQPKVGCWKVLENSLVGSTNSIIYYDATETRDSVRCDYAKLKGVSFNDVRAKKVK